MPDLDLAAADTMTQAAIAYAQQHGLRLAIAILDAGGNVVRMTRMDGCNFLSPDIARGKALGSAAWKLPSQELNTRFGSNPASAAGMVAITGGRIAPQQGALPIWDGTRCVGAMGASGARSDEDEAAVRDAIVAAGFSETSTGEVTARDGARQADLVAELGSSDARLRTVQRQPGTSKGRDLRDILPRSRRQSSVH